MVEVDVNCELSRPPAPGEHLQAALVVRLRTTDVKFSTPHVPVRGVTTEDGVTKAHVLLRVDASDPQWQIHDGVWDLYVDLDAGPGQPDDAKPERLYGGRIDQPGRDYTRLEPPGGDYRYHFYRTRSHNLTILVAGLQGHVELGEIWARDEAVDLVGRVFGTEGRALDSPAALDAVVRREDGGGQVSFRLEPEEGTVRVHGRIELADLLRVDANEPDNHVWRMHALSGDGRELRLATFNDDIRDRMKVIAYPRQVFGDTAPMRSFRPRWDNENDLVIDSKVVS